jgi:hypothetical protein
MKSISKLSKNTTIFCINSGYDVDKVKEAMKSTLFFSIQRCETKGEMIYNGVDYKFPYVIFNPYNIDIN